MPLTYDFPLLPTAAEELGGREDKGEGGGGVEKWAKASDAIAGEGGGHDERSEGVRSASAWA